MRAGASAAAAALGLLLLSSKSFAQASAPVQLRWQAPANCPQEAQVRQKLRDMLGASAADAAASRLRAEGQIEPVGERFRLTLNIHYDLVNGTRVVHASSCEDLGGVAAVTLALLFRAEHSSSTPLTARDLGGGSAAVAVNDRTAGAEDHSDGATNEAAGAGAGDAERRPPATPATAHALESSEQARTSDTSGSGPRRLHLLLRAPELRAELGVLPAPSYGIGFGAGLRYDAWRFLLSGTLWLAQDYEPGPFVGYGAHFGRVGGELDVCRGFRSAYFELSPCVLLALDDVSARGTGVGLSSTNPQTAFLSVGAGLQGLWELTHNLGLIFGVNGRIATSRPRFVSEGVGEISQVGPAAVGLVLGCEWLI